MVNQKPLSEFNSDMVVIAKVGKTHGLKGDLRLNLFSDDIHKALSYGQWWIKSPSKGSKWKRLQNEEIYSLTENKFLIVFDGIKDISSASKYIHYEIAVPRSSLPILSTENEFYWSDLIGLSVFNDNQENFGTVSEIIETGANDVLIIKDNKKNETLIPFVAQYISDVDLANKKIIVDWQIDY